MSISNDPALVANQLPISIEFPREEERFYEILTLWAKRVTNAVNTKEGGLYTLYEQMNFKQYYKLTDVNTLRNEYRKVFDMVNLNGGNIAPGVTVSFNHNIVGLFQAGLIYAQCTSNDANSIYFSVMGSNDVWLDNTLVYFKNNSIYTLKAVILVAEYLKN